MTVPWRALAEGSQRGLGPHPAPERLVAYRAGELPAGDEERLRDHLVSCAGCRQLLLDFVAFPDLAPPGGEPLANQEVEAAWQRMQDRLRSRELPDTTPGARRLPALLLWVLAALLLLACLGLVARMASP